MAVEEYSVDWEAMTQILSVRYGALREEIATVEAATPAEATAATNCYRGRADELNQLRAAVVENDKALAQRLPPMQLDEVQIGFQEREEAKEQAVGLGF